MKSFRTELEDPIVARDIVELEEKIHAFHNGQVDEEKFRSLRLARGVYGQRQEGVQMIRIKLPYGKMTFDQFKRILRVSDKYSNGQVHFTTRQDIQIHHVSLDETPELWAYLERSKVTLREACGNTVRNITASPMAGVDPKEPFDVTPYAHEAFEYFLRKPICQEMGRKFKIAFASSEEDDALTYIHDLGFIPVLKGKKRGFKVVVAGGLGAQPHLADILFEFLNEEHIIPLIESVLRIFDREGERNKRFKARFKFLYKEIGREGLLEMIAKERKALGYEEYWIKPASGTPKYTLNAGCDAPSESSDEFERWKLLNTFPQKQPGYRAVGLKIPLGNLSTKVCRELLKSVDDFVDDDIRVTRNQGLLFRFVEENCLPKVFQALQKLGLGEIGFFSVADIIACPGTDTCNLGISNSTALALELEEILIDEYPHLLDDRKLKINISGCMNSCGQHTVAGIGFHGSSMKHEGKVLPAIQILLGGINLGNGEARFADKVIKIPSRRAPDALRKVLNDWEINRHKGEHFADYYLREGKMYFYNLLKPYGDLKSVKPHHFIDWGQSAEFQTAIGVGECAGVTIDLVSTLLYDAEEKIASTDLALKDRRFPDAIYLSYSALVITAKALLTQSGVDTNTHSGIIRDFDIQFENGFEWILGDDFRAVCDNMKEEEPTIRFARQMGNEARRFLNWSASHAQQQKQS
ncbi:MAG: HEPN domain-containing protein [Flavobacteriales bacterium]|nr:HEPN domain-containing protein [Flavobacteriales bacterium]